jgi:hypothetical protein
MLKIDLIQKNDIFAWFGSWWNYLPSTSGQTTKYLIKIYQAKCAKVVHKDVLNKAICLFFLKHISKYFI